MDKKSPALLRASNKFTQNMCGPVEDNGHDLVDNGNIPVHKHMHAVVKQHESLFEIPGTISRVFICGCVP